MLLNQGRIERFLIDTIRKHSDLEVERGIVAESFEYDEKLEKDLDAYPITVKLRTLSDEEANPGHISKDGSGSQPANGQGRGSLLPDDWEELIQKSRLRQTKTEIVKAKFIIGCDGAHSWTRKQVNIPLEGSSTEHIWYVQSESSISMPSIETKILNK
jgi:phenol 2-monooxygenase